MTEENGALAGPQERFEDLADELAGPQERFEDLADELAGPQERFEDLADELAGPQERFGEVAVSAGRRCASRARSSPCSCAGGWW